MKQSDFNTDQEIRTQREPGGPMDFDWLDAIWKALVFAVVTSLIRKRTTLGLGMLLDMATSFAVAMGLQYVRFLLRKPK